VEPEKPPVIRTFPLGSRVAVWFERGVTILPVELNIRVEGSNKSADARREPPATRTRPSPRSVAVCS
jgi:hypothetical protein